jgi:hypothetical protein
MLEKEIKRMKRKKKQKKSNGWRKDLIKGNNVGNVWPVWVWPLVKIHISVMFDYFIFIVNFIC